MQWYKSAIDQAELHRDVMAALAGISKPGIGTTDLMIKLGASRDHMDSLTKALKQLRTTHPALAMAMPGEGRFGKSLILWHDPAL